MPSFLSFIIGFVLLLGGLVLASTLAGAPQDWIMVGALVGLAILIGSEINRQSMPRRERQRDMPVADLMPDR